MSQEIEEYVTQQRAKGYPDDQIRKVMLSYYPEKDVDAALGKKKRNMLWISVPTVLLLTILVGVLAMLFLGNPQPAPTTPYLSAKLTLEPQTVQQGADVTATVEVNDNIPTKHPVNLLVKVLDKDNNIVGTRRDFLVIENAGQRTTVVKAIMPPGAYTVELLASNDQGSEDAITQTLQVIPMPATIPIPTATPARTEFPSGKVGDIAQCKATEDPSCYAQIAAAYNDQSFCDKIPDPVPHDACLEFFVLHGDFSACDKVKNAQLKQSCNQVKTLQQSGAVASIPAQIHITDQGFNPKSITIKQNDKVIWDNQGSQVHTVEADNNAFNAPHLSPQELFEHTFTQKGTFTYADGLHPDLVGLVIVS